MNRRQLANEFANQSNARGRASNLYYDGRVCYSYGSHFPIAIIVGNGHAMINKDSYSKSTSVHQNAVQLALSQNGYMLSKHSTDEMKRFAGKV